MQYFMEESPPERPKAISINCIDADTGMVGCLTRRKGDFFFLVNKLRFCFTKLRYVFSKLGKKVSLFFFFLIIQYLKQHQGLQCL